MLTEGDEDRASIFPGFHQYKGDWHVIVKQETDLPIHLADIMRGEPTYFGLCDTSIIGTVGIWIDPDVTRTSIM